MGVFNSSLVCSYEFWLCWVCIYGMPIPITLIAIGRFAFIDLFLNDKPGLVLIDVVAPVLFSLPVFSF